MQNSDYLSVFFHVLLPVAYEVRQKIYFKINYEVNYFQIGWDVIYLINCLVVPVLPRVGAGVCRF